MRRRADGARGRRGGPVRLSGRPRLPPESLVEQQGDALESALSQALRTLEERADLLGRMAKRSGRRGMHDTKPRDGATGRGDHRHAAEIRNTILRLRNPEADDGASIGPMT